MNRHQQLMLITAEESGELVQACSKMMRHAEHIADVSEDYRLKLVDELGDVLCMISLIMEYGYASEEELEQRVNVKREKLKIWSNLLDVK